MENDEFDQHDHEAEPLDMLASYFEANGWVLRAGRRRRNRRHDAGQLDAI
jgi:hypothetical protein